MWPVSLGDSGRRREMPWEGGGGERRDACTSQRWLDSLRDQKQKETQKRPPLHVPGGARPRLRLEFWLSASRTARQCNSVVLGHTVFATLLQQLRKRIQTHLNKLVVKPVTREWVTVTSDIRGANSPGAPVLSWKERPLGEERPRAALADVFLSLAVLCGPCLSTGEWPGWEGTGRSSTSLCPQVWGHPQVCLGLSPLHRLLTGPHGLVSCAVNPVGQSALWCLKSLWSLRCYFFKSPQIPGVTLTCSLIVRVFSRNFHCSCRYIS